MAVAVRSITTVNDDDGSGAMIVTTPGTTAVGDLLVIFLSNDFYALADFSFTSIVPSATATQITGASIGTTNTANVMAWTAPVTTAGAATVTATTGHSDEEHMMAVWVISGANTASASDGSSNFNEPSDINPALASITVTGSTDMLIAHVQGNGNTFAKTLTPPGSMSPVDYDVTDGSFMRANGGHEILSASGATGIRTWTWNSNAGSVGGMIAIAASSGAAPTVDGNDLAASRMSPVVLREALAGKQRILDGTQTAITINGTATLTGAGALVALVTELAPVTSTGAGVLTPPNVIESVVATPTGAGALADSGVLQGVTASLTGAGAVTANSAQQVAAGLSGAGTMSAFVTEIVPATLTGAGTLTASAGGNQAGVCSMTGAGSLSVTATVLAPVTATGAGTLAAKVTQLAPVTMAGAGSTAALVTELATVAATGAGTLTASSAGSQSGTCSMTGAGTLSVTATVLAPVTMTGAGTLSAKATTGSTTTLVGAGAVSVIPVRQLVTAGLIGAGHLDASPAGMKFGVVNIVGAGVLSTDLNPCIIFRVYTGTTDYDSGDITARPNTGETEDPC